MTEVTKIIIGLKRRPGMTVEEFRDYYENVHIKVASKYLQPGMVHYMRRYLDPLPHLDTRELHEPEFDVITELWYEDEKAAAGLIWMLSEGRLPRDVFDDEHNVFDRPKTRYFRTTEFVTDLRQ
jgi:hypothetical protein